MNLPSKKQPPLPSPLLHKDVEEREMEQRAWPGFMGSMRECFRGILSLSLSPLARGEGNQIDTFLPKLCQRLICALRQFRDFSIIEGAVISCFNEAHDRTTERHRDFPKSQIAAD